MLRHCERPVCAGQVLRVAELQAEDYHMDRPLYFACREDRERFCATIVSGNGKVYQCLLQHKMDKEMSKKVCGASAAVRCRPSGPSAG